MRTALTPGCVRRNSTSSSAQLLSVSGGAIIPITLVPANRRRKFICATPASIHWLADSLSIMIGLSEDTNSAQPTPVPSRAPEFAAKIFADGGWLQGLLRLEHRPQQEQMARAVAAAFRDDEPLLFEAGTGVGKSLAYLVPGIIQAMDQTRQLIVSTHTISLQEQLETKDLPICRKLFKSAPELERYAAFKATVLVGKSNYL